MKFGTKLIHGGISKDTATDATSIPIYQTPASGQNGTGQPGRYEYSRSGNPIHHTLGTLIAELEGGSHGPVFSSGLAGIHVIISMFGPEDHILSGDDVHGGGFRLSDEVFVVSGLDYTTVNASDSLTVEAAIQPSTKALFLETSSNPLLKIIDIRVAAKPAKKHQSLAIVDNTLATPYF